MAKSIEIGWLDSDMRARDAAPLLIAARLADVEGRRPRPGTAGADAVHDMRVGARRLRVALDVLGAGALDREGRAVKQLQDALGRVRESQRHVKWLESPESRDAGAGPEQLLLQERRALEAAQGELDAALETWARQTAPRVARRLGRARPRGRLGGKRLRRRLESARAHVERAVDALDDRLEPGAVHALRIRAKKLRYLSELLRPGFPGDADDLLDRVAPLQDAIGDLHDDDVRLALLGEFEDRLGRRAAGLVALEARVRQSREQRATRVRRELERWRSRSLVKLWAA